MIERLIAFALNRGIAPAIFVAGLFLGALALWLMPREEEPQIVVPMIDVVIEAPGLSAEQVSRQVVVPIEKLLSQIPGIEHVYSQSHPLVLLNVLLELDYLRGDTLKLPQV